MNKRDFWNGTIGTFYVCVFFGILLFVAYLLYGPGVTISVPDFFWSDTSTSTPTMAVVIPPAVISHPLDGQNGTLFQCEDGKALKSEFTEGRVELALSDGRIVSLPQVVTDDGEIRYENTDGSFSFRNKRQVVFVEENGTTIYANCTTVGEI